MILTPVSGLVIALAALGANGDPDASELDGDWQIYSVGIDGATDDIDRKDHATLRLEKGQIVAIQPSEADDSEEPDAAVDFGFRLKPDSAPKQIDLFAKDADGKETDCWKCIYRLDRDDLTVCVSLNDSAVHDVIDDGPMIAGSLRPTNFDTRGHITFKLKRATPTAGKSP